MKKMLNLVLRFVTVEKYPENKELLFGYASILGTVVTIVFTGYTISQSNTPFESTATIVALGILNVILVISSMFLTRRYYYLQRDMIKLQNSFAPLVVENDKHKSIEKTFAKVLHNINHQARILISKLYRDLLRVNFSKDRQREIAFQKYFIFLLDNIKEIFDILTSDQCSVAIKLLVPDDNPELTSVKTHYRDSISFRERRSVDGKMKSYHYFENTAFKTIIREDYPNTFYYCNDLANEKGYVNKNSDWNKFYNACLVVPISMPTTKEENKVIIGFICVDNMKGGFDEAIAKNILASIADLNFLVYKVFQEYKQKKQEDYDLNQSKQGTASSPSE